MSNYLLQETGYKFILEDGSGYLLLEYIPLPSMPRGIAMLITSKNKVLSVNRNIAGLKSNIREVRKPR